MPATTSYGTEAQLRDLIAANPSIIPGVTDPSAVAVTEFGIPGVGRVDVVVVDSAGVITVCEAKLAVNAEMRRTVIGQVFAYAAGLTRMEVEDFNRAWAGRSGIALFEAVLGKNATDDDRDLLRDAIAANLATGQFRLLLAVDALTEELKLIVSYMAAHLDIDVVALELAYAEHGGAEVLVPRTWGSELSGQPASPRRPRSGNFRSSVGDAIDSVAASAETAAPGFGAVVRTVLERLAPRVDYLWSSSPGLTDPVIVAAATPPRQPAKIITTQLTTGIRVCFHWCQRLGPEQLDRALKALERDPNIASRVTDVRDADYRRGPMLPFVGVLDQPGAADIVAEALLILCE